MTMQSVSILLLAPCLFAAVGQAQQQTANADELVRSAVEAQQRGDTKAAIDDFRRALLIEPDRVEARVGLGEALAASGQFDAAIEEDSRALHSAPDNNAVRMNLAMAYYRKGDLNHARSEFETLHASHPLEVPIAVLLGYTLIKLGREAEAAKLLTPLEAGHEDNMQLEYVLGYALIQSGKEAEGLPRMEKEARATRSADAWVIAGSTRMQRREFREARADFDAAIELNPSLPGLQSLDGQALFALGERDAAVSAFQSALRADPRDVTANLYLGIIRLDQRDVESARPLLELALQLQPRIPLARLEMARLNNMTGNSADAVKTLEDLEKSDPDWLDPHVELATLYYKLHRPEDGQREREIVQKLEAQQQKEGPRGK